MSESFIQGAGGPKKQKTPRPPVEAPNSLRSKAVGRLVDLIGEGEIAGLKDGAKSIFFDDTPLQSADGSFNFEGVHHEERSGLPSQDHLKGFPESETFKPLSNIEIKQSSPVVQAVSAKLDAVRLTLFTPALCKQDKTTGDLNPTKIDFEIQIKTILDANFKTVKVSAFEGKTTSGYERSYLIEIPSVGNNVDIKIKRITPDSDTQDLRNQLFWTSITEIMDIKMTWPDSAVIGLEVDSTVFGNSIPIRTYEVRGLKVLVPTTYNPELRLYDNKIWDGTFKLAWTDNPAWIFYDLLTNARYGLGQDIDSSSIDKWALYEISKYCDSHDKKNNENPNPEPRFTFNACINNQQEAFQLLNSIAATFRSVIYWGSGNICCVQDSPKEPVQLVVPANVIDGKFDYQGSSFRARHTIVHVKWLDPNNNYREAIESVEDVKGVAQYGALISEVSYLGCTNKSQARRFGRWLLDTEQHETEVVTYVASLDHAGVCPGDIIQVADPAHPANEQLRFGGRIKAINGSRITLDSKVNLKYGDTSQQLTVVLDDGALESREIKYEATNNTDSILLTESFSENVQPNNIWMLSTVFTENGQIKPRLYRVLGVQELTKNQFQITALFYDKAKFNRIDNERTDEITPKPNYALKKVAKIDAHESLFKTNNTVRTRVHLSWQNDEPKAATFTVSYRLKGHAWTNTGETSLQNIDIDDLPAGTYDFCVVSSGFANCSEPALLTDIKVLGNNRKPGKIQNLIATPLPSGVQLKWGALSALDLIGYNVRMGPRYETAKVISENYVGTSLFVPMQDALQHHFWVRAVTQSRILGESAAVESGVGAPKDVTSFVVTNQAEHLHFTWTSVQGLDVQYEVRMGKTWDASTMLFRSDSTTATTLLPGNGDAIFWIKAVSSFGLYSKNSTWAKAALTEDKARKEILTLDCKKEGWLGTKEKLEVTADNYLQLKGNNGRYSFDVELPDKINARNQLLVEYRRIGDDSLTWSDANFNWNDVKARASWLPLDNVEDVSVKSSIEIFSEDENRYLSAAPFGIGDYNYKKSRVHVDIATINPGKVVITDIKLKVSLPTTTQSATTIIDKPVTTTVNFSQGFLTAPHLQVSPLTGPEPFLIEISNLTTTSFDCLLRNKNNGKPTTGEISWAATGH